MSAGNKKSKNEHSNAHFQTFFHLSSIMLTALITTSLTFLTTASAPNLTQSDAPKQKDQQMKQKHALSIMSGFLIVSAAMITGLATKNMTTDRKNKVIMHAQKPETNDDSAISLDELTSRQNYRFAMLNRHENGMIEKHEFNARLVMMFHRMDRDGNGVLQGNELPDHRHGGKNH